MPFGVLRVYAAVKRRTAFAFCSCCWPVCVHEIDVKHSRAIFCSVLNCFCIFLVIPHTREQHQQKCTFSWMLFVNRAFWFDIDLVEMWEIFIAWVYLHSNVNGCVALSSAASVNGISPFNNKTTKSICWLNHTRHRAISIIFGCCTCARHCLTKFTAVQPYINTTTPEC